MPSGKIRFALNEPDRLSKPAQPDREKDRQQDLVDEIANEMQDKTLLTKMPNIADGHFASGEAGSYED